MCFGNEGTIEFIIQGLTVHEVRDFSGELIGRFSDYAVALGAQRDFNIKKMVVSKKADEANKQEVFSCVFYNYVGESLEAFVIHNAMGWHGPEKELHSLIIASDSDHTVGPKI